MDAMNRSWLPLVLLLHLFFLGYFSKIPFCSCQSQNIETFYPFPIGIPSPAPSPNDANNNPPNSTTFSPPSPSVVPPPPQSSSSNGRTIVKAVAATAVSTFVLAMLLFFSMQRFVNARRKTRVGSVVLGGGQPPARSNIHSRPVVVDENGLDVLYWKKLEEGNKKMSYQNNDVIDDQEDQEEGGMVMVQSKSRIKSRKFEAIQETPLLRGKSSSSHIPVVTEDVVTVAAAIGSDVVETRNLNSQPSIPPTLPLAPPLPPPPQRSLAAVTKQNRPPPPPPPPPTPAREIHKPAPPPPPPPLPPTPAREIHKPAPLPPPVPAQSNPSPPPPPPPKAAPPPPPKAVGAATSLAAKGKTNSSDIGESATGEGATVNGNGQMKLKPLHWDKLNKNPDHSMVWDKVNGGSFRLNDDLMEALFGYVATNRRSPRKDNNINNPNSSNSTAHIVILDPRKSQNMAIVLKTLAISREELLYALMHGQGLDADSLEKLMRIGPTKEEQTQILKFNGDPSRLAHAESFLYHLLKAVPSAFTRINAMLFRSNYDTEILQFKESLQVLELGCKELRNRGVFMKLLEAILKAGNRMNAGTARGNAEAFKLTSLQKLSDVKSTDGKTTLLHFVVEEVVRSEGKHCVMNRDRRVSRNSSYSSSSSSMVSETSMSKEGREKEYMKLGLPLVGGLSAEFSNVKRAAQIDYDSLACTCSALSTRATEVKQLLLQSANDREGGEFAKEMKGFIHAVEEELKVLKEEQMRIMKIVERTTNYYQPGGSKDRGPHPLQLFVIIKDFLGMVDQVCIDIARNLQRRKTPGSGGSSPASPPSRKPVRFPNLPEHFMMENSRGSSSESDSDF